MCLCRGFLATLALSLHPRRRVFCSQRGPPQILASRKNHDARFFAVFGFGGPSMSPRAVK